MKEDPSTNLSEAPDESESENDIISLLRSMQQQLHSLERKIDSLTGQRSGVKSSQDRSYQKRSFSKPFRTFDHPQHQGKREHGHGSRERDSVQGHFYEHRPGEKGRGSNPRKRTSPYRRKDRE